MNPTAQHTFARPRVASWDKIAPPRPPVAVPVAPGAVVDVPGLTKDKALNNRAKAKFFSWHIAKELAALNSPLKRQYLRTLDCCNEIRQEGNKFTTRYCGNRWCLVCARIRTGKLINKYAVLLEQLHEPQFITLTVKNQIRLINEAPATLSADAWRKITTDEKELRNTQRMIFSHFRKCADMLRKHGIVIKGVRKYECVPSKDLRGFHPHIHWLIDGTADVEQIAHVWHLQKLPAKPFVEICAQIDAGAATAAKLKSELIIQLWLKTFKGFATRNAQDARPANKATLKEIFKYTTKLFTQAKDANGQRSRVLPVRLLDSIYIATKNVRTVTVTGYVTRKPILREVKPVEPVDVFNDDAMKKYEAAMLLYNQKLKKHNAVMLEYLTYKELTEVLEEDINKNLDATIVADAPEQHTVFIWSGGNWFDITTGQPLTHFEVTRKEAKFIERFAYY